MASTWNRLAVLLVASGFILGGCRIDEVDGGSPGDGDCDGPGTPGFPGDGGGGPNAVCLPFCDTLIACGYVASSNVGQCLQSCVLQWNANPGLTESGCACVEQTGCQPDPTQYQCPGAPIPNGLGPDAGQWANCLIDETVSADGSCQEDIECPSPNGWSYYTVDCSTKGTTGTTAGTVGDVGTVGATGTTGTTGSVQGSVGTTGGAGSSIGTQGTVGGTSGATIGGIGSTGGTSSTAGTSSAGSTGGTTGNTACTRNQDCAYDQDCVNGTCLVRCTASCECPTGDACNADGYCQSQIPPPQACDADCDCNSGQHCVNHLCG